MEAVASEISATEEDRAVISPRHNRRELREMVERTGAALFSDEADLCQANDGDCFG